MRAGQLLAVALAAAGPFAAPAAGQRARQVEQSVAEVAIAAGRLDLAERVLFEESQRAPREPSARGALGSFLAARGKFLVGATLLDEALVFGGDSTAIESRLFHIYRWAGLFDRAAALRHSPASQVEREAMARAAGTVPGGERAATVPMTPNEGLGIGRITLTLSGEQVDADIQPAGTGLQLPATMQLFGVIEAVGAHGDTTFGVARSISIGGVTLGPVPVMLVPGLRTARIGLDLLAHLYPTFDAGARTLTVRAAPPQRVVSQAMPVLLTFPAGIGVLAREREAPVGLQTPAGRAALRGLRWTLDLAGGVIVVER